MGVPHVEGFPKYTIVVYILSGLFIRRVKVAGRDGPAAVKGAASEVPRGVPDSEVLLVPGRSSDAVIGASIRIVLDFEFRKPCKSLVHISLCRFILP